MNINKSRFLVHTMHHLYSDTQEILNQQLEQIYSTQRSLVDASDAGFFYRGKHWCNSGYKGLIKSIHPSLKSDMDGYIASSTSLETEMRYVQSYIQSILNNCTHAEYLYAYLPSALHTLLNHMGIPQSDAVPPDITPSLIYNQKGKDLLIVRIMRNLTGA